MARYVAWQNSWLHCIDIRFWSLLDHASSSAMSADEICVQMQTSHVKHPCLPREHSCHSKHSVWAYVHVWHLGWWRRSTRGDQVSHVGVEHPGPGSARTHIEIQELSTWTQRSDAKNWALRACRGTARAPCMLAKEDPKLPNTVVHKI